MLASAVTEKSQRESSTTFKTSNPLKQRPGEYYCFVFASPAVSVMMNRARKRNLSRYLKVR